MIDNMSIKVENFSRKEWAEISNELEGLKISPEKNSGMLSNLKFQYFPNISQLLIQNSLHKFFNARVREIPIGKHNYDDFDIDKLKMAGVYLCEFVNRKFTDFELIGRFEYGLNINVNPMVPMDILNNYFSYSSTRNNPFVTHGVRRGKPYGRSCYLTDYRIKFYDKSKESQLSTKGILRYEICNGGIGRLKQLLSTSKVSFEDLIKEKTFEILSKDLLSKYDKIVRLPMDCSAIPRTELLELYAYSNSQIQAYDRLRLSAWKYSQLRKMGKALFEKHAKGKYHKQLRKEMVDKLQYLSNPTLYSIRGRINKELKTI